MAAPVGQLMAATLTVTMSLSEEEVHSILLRKIAHMDGAKTAAKSGDSGHSGDSTAAATQTHTPTPPENREDVPLSEEGPSQPSASPDPIAFDV